MRILLDEDLPRRLAAMLVGHEVSTVQRSGWTGIKKLMPVSGVYATVGLDARKNSARRLP